MIENHAVKIIQIMYKLRGKQDLNKDLKSFSMGKTQKFPRVDFIKGIGIVRDSVCFLALRPAVDKERLPGSKVLVT